jgi:hypothetical protein
MEKIYVICGTREEFNWFMRKKMAELYTPDNGLSVSHFVYVDNVDKIRGVSNPSGWFFGTWHERKNIREILGIMLVCCSENKEKYYRILSMLDRLNDMENKEEISKS